MKVLWHKILCFFWIHDREFLSTNKNTWTERCKHCKAMWQHYWDEVDHESKD